MTMSAAVMDKAVDVIDALRVQLAARERLIVELRQMLADARADLTDRNAELDQLRARVATRNVQITREMVNS